MAVVKAIQTEKQARLANLLLIKEQEMEFLSCTLPRLNTGTLLMHTEHFTGSNRWLRTTVFQFVSFFAVATLLGSMTEAAPQPGEEKSDKDENPLSLIAEGNRPLLTITFASADRFMEQSRYVFDAAGNPEAFKVVEKFVSETLNNLDGFNREKPFGIMAYLPVAIPPLPEFIAFVPVDSVEAATKLIEKAPVVIRKETEEGRYEVIGPNRTFPVLMRDGYAFMPIGNDPPEEALDRDLPNPSQLLAGQAQQFDVSVRLDVESIPVATRTLLMTLISTGISSQLQQRDGEPDGAYKIRRTEGERGLEAIKMLITECQQITLGLKVDPTEQAVNIDMIVDALEGSKFLKEIFQSTEKPSYFIPLLDDDAAVSLSMSSMMAERDKEAYIEMMEGVKMEVTRLIEENKLGATPDENSPIGQAMTAVQRTLEEGHVDVFAQFYRDSSGKLAIVWAGRILEGDAMAAGLLDALTRLKDVDDIKKAGELQIGAAEHLGITFHRLTFDQQPPEAVAVFGKQIGLTIGIGSQSLWGVIGGEDSLATLTSVMDKLEEAVQSPSERTTPPNFRVIVNVNQLVEMAMIADTAGSKAREEKELAAAAEAAATATLQGSAPPEEPKAAAAENTGRRQNRNGRGEQFARRRDQGGKIFRDTMAEGDDRIEIDSRLTETGMRSRIRLEEGFVKIFGRLLANAFAPQEEEVEVETDAVLEK